jgi:hypothetical protein
MDVAAASGAVRIVSDRGPGDHLVGLAAEAQAHG